MTNDEFGRIDFELKGGRQNLQEIANSIDERENFLRSHGEHVKSLGLRKKNNEERETFHVNRTTLEINYSGSCIPVSVYGERNQIEENSELYKKLIGQELIPAGEFYNYFKPRIIIH